MQAVVKCAMMLCFVFWVAQFVLTRVSASISAIKDYDDEKEHSKRWCKICEDENMVKDGGKSAINCITWCHMDHDKTTRLELILDAITKITYLCGDHPCEEVFAKFLNFKALLFMLIMAYGMKYTIVCTTSSESPGILSYIFRPVAMLFHGILAVFYKIFDVLDNTGKAIKLE